MAKKICVAFLVAGLLATMGTETFAGALVRWAGNFAGTTARTYVPGATVGQPICIDTKGGAPPPALSSTCFAMRTPPGYGGAWAFAYANIVSGKRVSISASGTWGLQTYAGKNAGDTTRCSTYVEVIPVAESFIDLNIYGYLEAPLESDQSAMCNISAIIGRDTLFHGAINFRGDQANTTVDGAFNTAPIVYGEGNATIQHLFPGIDIGGHDPDSVIIAVSTDAARHKKVPSMTVYGAALVVILILVSAMYLYRSRRRIRCVSA